MGHKAGAWILLASAAVVLGMPLFHFHVSSANHEHDVGVCIYCASTAHWAVADEVPWPRTSQALEISALRTAEYRLRPSPSLYFGRAPPALS
jgi:hypothetical protein